LYDAETWKLTKADKRKITAVEMDFGDRVGYRGEIEYEMRESGR